MSIHSGPADWWTEGTNSGRKHIATKGIVQNGLVLNLDAGISDSYPGTGTTWYDLSGNNNHVTLYNGVLFDSISLYSNGIDAYAKTTNTLDLTSMNKITVEVIFKDVVTNSGFMVYEHTDNWNTNNIYNGSISYGGFGMSTNSHGSTSGSVPYGLHIQLRGNNGYSGINVSSIGLLSYQHYCVEYNFSKSSAETTLNYNGSLYPSTLNYGVNNTSNFGNDYLYFFKRGSGTVGSQGKIAVFRIYNRSLTDQEIRQNFNSLRNRFGL